VKHSRSRSSSLEKTVRVVWRHRPGEVGIEFTDGSRIFINRAEEGLELSVNET